MLFFPTAEESKRLFQGMGEVEPKQQKPGKTEDKSSKNPFYKQYHARNKASEVTSQILQPINTVMSSKIQDGDLLQGFTCASGKAIQTSDEALERAQHLMTDIENDLETGNEEFNDKNVCINGVDKHQKGFMKEQVENQPVNSEECCLMMSQTNENDPKGMAKESCVNSENNHITVSEIPGDAIGFQSASGKKINVSSKAEMRAKSLMKEIEKNFETEERLVEYENNHLSKVADSGVARNFAACSNSITGDIGVHSQAQFKSSGNLMPGFQCASGKNVEVSQKALIMANKLINEVENQVEGTKTCDIEESKSHTAKESKVEMNEDASELGSKLTDNYELSRCALNRRDTSVVSGFQSASGKNIKCNDKIVKHSNKLTAEPDPQVEPRDDINNKEVLLSCGFQSASGKTIEVSDKALKQASKLIEEVETQVESKKCKESKEMPLLPGFQSASGKNINVSDKALKQAGQLMDEVNAQFESNQFEENVRTNPLSSGFQSASGKGLVLSESSIHRAHLLMQEVHSDIQHQATSDASSGILDHNLENLENTVKHLRYQGRRVATGNVQNHNHERTSMPQGFRPFKPPRMSKLPDKLLEKNSINSIKNDDMIHAGVTKQSDENSLKQTVVSELTSEEVEIKPKKCDLQRKKFEDCGHMSQNEVSHGSTTANDGFTLTQMAEISEGTAAFLELDQDTQFEDTEHGVKTPLEDSLLMEDGNNGILLVSPGNNCHHLIDSKEQHDSKLSNVEMSQKSVEIAKSFLVKEFSNEITPIHTFNSDPKILQNTAEGKGNEEDLLHLSMEHIEITGLDIEDNKYKVSDDASNVKVAAFVRFQTASGKSHKISNESLKKAQSVLELKDGDLESGTYSKSKEDLKIVTADTSEMNSEECMHEKSVSELVNLQVNFASVVTTEKTKLHDSIFLEMQEHHVQESGYISTSGNNREHAQREEFTAPQQTCTGTGNRGDLLSRSCLVSTDQNDSGCVDMSGNISFTSEILSLSAFKAKQTGGKLHDETTRKESIPCDSNMNGRICIEKEFKHLQEQRGKENSVTKSSASKDHKDVIAGENDTSTNNIKSKCQSFGFLTALDNKNTVSETLKRVGTCIADADCDNIAKNEQRTVHFPPDKPDEEIRMRYPSSSMGTSAGNVKEVDKEREVAAISSNGFRTASGQKVKVSKSSLDAARQILSDQTDLSERMKQRHGETCPASVCFQAASQKNVLVSERALKVAENMLNDLEETLKCEGNSVKPFEGKRVITDFDTAHCIEVNASQTASEAIQEMLKEESQSFGNDQTIEEKNIADVKSQMFIADFEVPSGNKASYSETTVNKARNMLHENTQVSINETLLDKSKYNIEPSKICGGFQTASGKKVSVSETALKAATKMLQDERNVSGNDDIAIMSTSNLISPSCCGGFHTASGNKVTISETALKAAEEMFSEHTDVLKESDIVQSLGKRVNKPTFSGGFQTAGGNKVSISESSLKAAKQLFAESSVTQDDMSEMSKEGTSPSAFDKSNFGFQTASGNRVVVSNTALNAAKKLLSDDSFLSAAETNDRPHKSSGQSASALNDSRQDVLVPNSNPTVSSDISPHIPPILVEKANQGFSCGFQTARGTKVEVSDEAVARAKQFLNDDPNTSAVKMSKAYSMQLQASNDNGKNISTANKEEVPKNKADAATYALGGSFAGGFQTARGRVVKVSDKSLKAAKQFLHEEERDPVRVIGSPCEIRDKHDPHTDKSNKLSSGAQNSGSDMFETDVVSADNTVIVGKSGGHRFLKEQQNLIERFQGGFQTASGTKVNVSRQAFEAAKKIVDDEDDRVKSSETEVNQRKSELYQDDVELHREEIKCNRSTLLQESR